VAQPPQRLAAGAHPLLALRHRLHPAPGHPDVLPGDPLFALDPIYRSILDPRARERLVATYDHDLTEHEWCTGYRWDIVLSGSARTPTEEDA
jgi:hypothetical protein